MTRQKILGSHVKRLLTGVSDHGKKHLAEVDADLTQTNALLEEAVDKLTRSFLAIHAAVGARQASVDALLAGADLSAHDIAALRGMSDEVGLHVNAAVTSLQFQDMTSQLIARTQTRITGLRAFLGTLGAHGEAMAADMGSDDVVALLGKLSVALAIQSLELRSVLRKAVSQQRLDSGDVELF